MNQPWICMCSPSRSPLPPLSPSHPSGSSQCTSPEHLSHASNLGWWSVSPLIAYLFQCCSLRTSHPPLLPQSLKVCSVHLFLFFCFAYRVIFTTVNLSESDCVHIFIDVYVPSIKCAGDRFISMYIHTHVTKPTSLCQTWPVPRRSLMPSVSSSTRGQYYSKLSPRKLILKWLFCAFWFLFSLAVFKILSVLVAGSPFLLHI